MVPRKLEPGTENLPKSAISNGLEGAEVSLCNHYPFQYNYLPHSILVSDPGHCSHRNNYNKCAQGHVPVINRKKSFRAW